LSPGASFGSGLAAGLKTGFAAAGLAALVTAGLLACAGAAVPPDAELSPEAAAAACSWRVADCLLTPTALLALSIAFCRPVWPGAVAETGVEPPPPLFERSSVNFAPTSATAAMSAMSTGLETWSTLHVSAARAAT
jgi:hypothetical protein